MRLPLLVVLCTAAAANCAADPVDYVREVRPILANHCFACHGLDTNSRQADLRLDVRNEAVADREGAPAIVPGNPDASLVIQRINSAVPEARMPPPETKKVLSERERQLLSRWIREGAPYADHWSLLAPSHRTLPSVEQTKWPRNALDYFILDRLERESFSPSAEASQETLLRRASLDLIGLPPTIEELDEFLSDSRPDAFERAVDRLLASPHFGERMAIDWLDLARYADTNGYFGDKPRSVWLWREWVIQAFNENMPFDQFTVEQLAGDLMPNATVSQRIATGFNRNHMANNETGLIDEEYRVEYVADRVETVAATWLGLTVGCARCHDHKFDPISQKEYYQLFAFFNNGPETGLITQDDPPPTIQVPSLEQERKLQQLLEQQQDARNAFEPLENELKTQLASWEEKARQLFKSPDDDSGLIAQLDFDDKIDGRVLGTTIKFDRGISGQAAVFDGTQHAELAGEFDWNLPWKLAIWFQAEGSLGCLLSKIEPEGDRRGIEVLWQKGRIRLHLVNRWGVSALELATAQPVPSREWQFLVMQHDGSGKAAGVQIYLNGELVPVNIERDTLSGSVANTQPLRIGRRDSGLGFYGKLDALRLSTRRSTPDAIAEQFRSERIGGILAVPPNARSAQESQILRRYFVEHHAEPRARAANDQLVAAEHAVEELRRSIPTTLVMQELEKARPAHVLVRGQYDQPGEPVSPDVPAVLPPLPPEGPRNRLTFAHWLVSPSHPLTPRVAVNRLWQQCFGQGLVRTTADFGIQSELPSHPELLDWLALRFVETGWDVKAMLKLIVTSSTYRQSSAATPKMLERDPENRLYARGSRFRLPGELIRDQALAASGLLVHRIGGPSVKPYQPPGLWEAVSYNGEETYVPDSGGLLWRRSLYTYWKRQSPPPGLLAFDAPTREKCVVRRAQTNTPLQAMVLLNDETYLEAARELAREILADPGSDAVRLSRAFRRVTSRSPAPEEIEVLSTLLDKRRADEVMVGRSKNSDPVRTELESFSGDHSRLDVTSSGLTPAARLGQSSDAAGNANHDAELAAWTVTLHVLFNLDETVTRR